ncbi:MAG: FAD-dependent oxidoreductase [SAR202 cluster bacterium]|nr:FAD-dependent oxidoreductase [SAR202 cluster bacterium]MDP6514860.1 FAD-dependent oxidoreductase [SAR202 cluster bacterium]MDP6714491.1 FAD-dependent oxidoreductase [SAR202 cluster bacterium]
MPSREIMRVAVIGAGIVGASIAFYLSRLGVEVTVLEAETPGAGTSGRSFAWINSFGKQPRHYHDLNRRALDTWDRFARLLDGETGLRWGGHLSWASNEDTAEALKAQVQRLQSWGYNARMIDEKQMLALEPGLRPGDVAAAAYAADEGHVMPPRVANLCLDRVRLSGGRVHLDRKVTGIQPANGGVTTIETTGGPVECDVVVLCAGLGNTELAAYVGIDLPQQVSPGVLITTDPQPPILRSVAALYCPPISDAQPEIHIRQDIDGVLTIGEANQESLARDDSQTHADDLLSRAIHYLPAANGAKAIPVPVGYRPLPMDGLPVVGFAQKAPSVYIALTHSGVTLAPLIGEFAATEITTGTPVDVLEPYRLERFER